MDNGYRVVYIWGNGAFVSDNHESWADGYKELVEQYGQPTLTEVRKNEDIS